MSWEINKNISITHITTILVLVATIIFFLSDINHETQINTIQIDNNRGIIQKNYKSNKELIEKNYKSNKDLIATTNKNLNVIVSRIDKRLDIITNILLKRNK